ncbi:MAG: hypothetical protein AAF993_15145 [Pseudomonadota bacterium]
MTDYQIAWLVIGGAALGGLVSVWFLLRRSRWGLLPWLAMSLCLTFFVVPVQVPNYPDQLAPAFVVAIFEMFFQIDGQPQASLRMLGLSLGFVALATVLIYFFAQRRTSPEPPPEQNS